MWGLDPDTTERRGIRGYRERGISHSVEHDNVFNDPVVARLNILLLVICVRDHIGRVHVVEHNFI